MNTSKVLVRIAAASTALLIVACGNNGENFSSDEQQAANSNQSADEAVLEQEALEVAGYKTEAVEGKKKTPPPTKDPLADTRRYEACSDKARKQYPQVASAIDVCSRAASKAFWANVEKLVGSLDKSKKSAKELQELYAAEKASISVQNEVLKACYAEKNISLQLISKYHQAITSCFGPI